MTNPTPNDAVLDVVVPVYNEQTTLAACVLRLARHLVDTFPYPFRITVADNASTDATWREALALAERLPEVAAVHLDRSGRGLALKRAWLASPAPILAYMDVDLTTDLDAVWPLVAPLMSGHSDLAIGTRLHRSPRVVRGLKREVISRGYNLLLRGALGARCSDAHFGFKAIRRDVAHELLPLVEDSTWFSTPSSWCWPSGPRCGPRGARRLVRRPGLASGHPPRRRWTTCVACGGCVEPCPSAPCRSRTSPTRWDEVFARAVSHARPPASRA